MKEIIITRHLISNHFEEFSKTPKCDFGCYTWLDILDDGLET
jgi:hypothetical protein